MKKNISLKIILFTFIFFIQSCGIYVQYDYDSDVNFDNYSSYSFYQPDIDELEISDLDKKRILKSLDLGLKSKGLERSSSPDLLVTFETKSKERVLCKQLSSIWMVSICIPLSIFFWLFKSSRYSLCKPN